MDFIHDLPEELAQPYEVESQSEFIAIKQWDGTGEYQHWVLIPKVEVDSFIDQLKSIK